MVAGERALRADQLGRWPLEDHLTAVVTRAGPRSITQSARATTSRLCSITITVRPDSTNRSEADEVVDVLHVEPRGRLVENVDLRLAGHLDRQLSWRSPPESVSSSWPSEM